MRDWLPEEHLAHHVSDLLDGLDLTAFHAPYEADGRRNAPYEAQMMLKILIYGYATGGSVAGDGEEAGGRSRFSGAGGRGNFPKHRTICEYRRRHLEEFRKLFVKVVGLAREKGLANFGKLLIDGTKVRPNASKHTATS